MQTIHHKRMPEDGEEKWTITKCAMVRLWEIFKVCVCVRAHAYAHVSIHLKLEL